MFQLTRPVAQLLGVAGLTPQHPDTYITAWRNRQALRDEEQRRTNAVIRDQQQQGEAAAAEADRTMDGAATHGAKRRG